MNNVNWKISFEDHPVVQSIKGNLSFDRESIASKLKSGEDDPYVNYYLSKAYNKGIDRMNELDFASKSPESRVQSQE